MEPNVIPETVSFRDGGQQSVSGLVYTHFILKAVVSSFMEFVSLPLSIYIEVTRSIIGFQLLQWQISEMRALHKVTSRIPNLDTRETRKSRLSFIIVCDRLQASGWLSLGDAVFLNHVRPGVSKKC